MWIFMLLSPGYLCQRFVTQQEREWDVEKHLVLNLTIQHLWKCTHKFSLFSHTCWLDNVLFKCFKASFSVQKQSAETMFNSNISKMGLLKLNVTQKHYLVGQVPRLPNREELNLCNKIYTACEAKNDTFHTKIWNQQKKWFQNGFINDAHFLKARSM